jgi:ferritin-like metal-binding protein YciE
LQITAQERSSLFVAINAHDATPEGIARCLERMTRTTLASALAFETKMRTLVEECTMASLDSLEDLLQDELKDIYDAEKQLTKALPKLAKKATSDELRSAFEDHLRQTEQHIDRLEQVFEQMGMPARGKKCEGMQHLIAEGNDMIGEADAGPTRDAVMIAAAQKVEHYEIASYGTICTWANVLGKGEVASILEETLQEEKETDERLTGIAEGFVNEAAADEEDEKEEAPASGRRPAGGRRAMTGAARRHQAADRTRQRRRR